MKKVVLTGLTAGLASAMLMFTGCSSKDRQLAPTGGELGLLGSRGQIPDAQESPMDIKRAPQPVPGGAIPKDMQELPAGGNQAVNVVSNGASAAGEPAGLENDSVFGGSALAPVVAPGQANAQGGQANATESFVPAPVVSAGGNGGGIMDLSVGNTATQGGAQPALPPAGGQTVAPAVGGQAAPVAGDQTYRVMPGDSLTVIARRYNVKWEDLAVLNNLKKNDTIKVGQILILPATAVMVAQPAQPAFAPVSGSRGAVDVADPNASPRPGAPAQPAVAPAQTVTAPAQPVAAPAQPAVAGGARRASAKPLPADGKYTVKDGDSLWKIAHKYGLSVNELRAANNLKGDRLRIGQVLILVIGQKGAAVQGGNQQIRVNVQSSGVARQQSNKAAAPSKNTGLSADKHVVVSGDNLWTLARTYKVRESDLRDWNNLKSTNLKIGQVLIVRAPNGAAPAQKEAAQAASAPAKSEPVDNGAVKIEATVNNDGTVTVKDEAGVLQNVETNGGALVIDVNQAMTNAAPVQVNVTEPTTMVVSEGQTLDSILKEYSIQLEVFKKLNPWFKDGDELKPGDKIKIPFVD